MNDLYINWYPNYWTEEEKKIIFNFWVDRYIKYNTNMSPTGNSTAGGYGFFDTERESIKHITEKRVDDINHPINFNYNKRRERLIKEQQISQLDDKIRLQLILTAEKYSYEYWKTKSIFLLKNKLPDYYLKEIKAKLFFQESLYKESFAQLMEYDKKYNHPISNPDRDLIENPITFYEYYLWLTRNKRELIENSDDAILINSKLNDNEKVELLNSSNFNTNITYVPNFLHRIQEEREKLDFVNGIKRTKSGHIENYINNEKLGDLNNSSDLINKFNETKSIFSFFNNKKNVIENKNKQEDVSNGITNTEVSSFLNDISEQFKTSDQININVYKDILNGIDSSDFLQMGLDEDSEDDDTGEEEDQNIPDWMKIVKQNRSTKYKIFDRNKQLELITSEWKPLKKRKIEGDFWKITEEKIKIFKDSAVNLWQNKKIKVITNDIKTLLKNKANYLSKLKKSLFVVKANKTQSKNKLIKKSF